MDLEKAIQMLDRVLSAGDFVEALSELSKILPKSLLSEDLISRYVRITLNVLREAPMYV